MALDDDREFRRLLERRISLAVEAEGDLQRRLAELNEELAITRARRGAAEELYRSEYGDLPAPSPGSPRPRLLDFKSVSGPYSGLAWLEALTRVLADSGGPLHVREIWQRLADGGFQTSARDPVRSIVSFAVRSPDRFLKVGPNQYALVAAGEEARLTHD
jgi:HB1, ASXL, restriction endonuclease HTH domain